MLILQLTVTDFRIYCFFVWKLFSSAMLWIPNNLPFLHIPTHLQVYWITLWKSLKHLKIIWSSWSNSGWVEKVLDNSFLMGLVLLHPWALVNFLLSKRKFYLMGFQYWFHRIEVEQRLIWSHSHRLWIWVVLWMFGLSYQSL